MIDPPVITRDERVSMYAVRALRSTVKRFVEVALVVDALEAKRLVLVLLVVDALKAERVPVVVELVATVVDAVNEVMVVVASVEVPCTVRV